MNKVYRHSELGMSEIRRIGVSQIEAWMQINLCFRKQPIYDIVPQCNLDG